MLSGLVIPYLKMSKWHRAGHKEVQNPPDSRGLLAQTGILLSTEMRRGTLKKADFYLIGIGLSRSRREENSPFDFSPLSLSFLTAVILLCEEWRAKIDKSALGSRRLAQKRFGLSCPAVTDRTGRREDSEN